jgi:FixJ family two-component response regulator
MAGIWLASLKLHYLTLGTPLRDASGAIANGVLRLHGTAGSSRTLLAVGTQANDQRGCTPISLITATRTRFGLSIYFLSDAETVTIPFIFLTAKAEKLDIRAGMNLGADDYLTKPVAEADLLAAIRLRLERAVQQAVPDFKPNFHSAIPLQEMLGLTTSVAETLLWLAQGKTNGEIATILGNSESTVKKHVFAISKSSDSTPEPQPACAL